MQYKKTSQIITKDMPFCIPKSTELMIFNKMKSDPLSHFPQVGRGMRKNYRG
jgi:hypothetical protein